jgi:hypothetical protein
VDRAQWWLVLLLRLTAIGCALAIFAVFMPRHWMAWCHERVIPGRFPEGPVVDYLARSVSLFYAGLAVVLWLASTDVRRYAPLIRLLAIVGMVFGAIITTSNVLTGMPRVWQVGEALSIFPICIIVLGLERRIVAGSE